MTYGLSQFHFPVPWYRKDSKLDVALMAITLAALAIAAYAIKIGSAVRPKATPALGAPSQSQFSHEEGTGDQVPPQALIFPDYVDNALLDEVAQQLGIQVDPVGFTLGSASRQSTDSALTSHGTLKAGPLETGITAQEAEGEELEANSSVSIQKRSDFRTKIRAVLRELDHRKELVRDLNILPSEATTEAAFIQAAVLLTLDWELVDAKAGNSKEEDRRVEIREHLQEVRDAARIQVQESLLKRYEQLGRTLTGRLTHINTRWHVHLENGAPALGLSRVFTGPLLPRAFPDRDFIAAPNHEIWVPLTPEKLLTHGKQRITEGHFVEASIFGRIDSFDSSRGALIVLPIAVYSEQEPAEISESHLVQREKKAKQPRM